MASRRFSRIFNGFKDCSTVFKGFSTGFEGFRQLFKHFPRVVRRFFEGWPRIVRWFQGLLNHFQGFQWSFLRLYGFAEMSLTWDDGQPLICYKCGNLWFHFQWFQDVAWNLWCRYTVKQNRSKVARFRWKIDEHLMILLGIQAKSPQFARTSSKFAWIC